ncbi:MAG: membrane lipoprotein lipid attachment site-containing protein [Ruminococcus sp.]|nr:membrane lipoprotein lipid attachment site-containing protein [Ruminococcus sp.]
MTKIILVLSMALLLTGCSESADSSDAGGSVSTAEVSSAQSSESTDNTKKIEDFKYKEVRTDPYEAEKLIQSGETGVTDYEPFTRQSDIADSIWGEYYHDRYGCDKDKLLPACPEGWEDCGGGANLDYFTLGYSKTDEWTGEPVLISVKTYLSKKYTDTDTLFDDIQAEDTGDLVRDNVYKEDDAVIEHFADSIYYQYRLTLIDSQGFRYEVTSAQPTVTLDDLIAFNDSLKL